MCVLGMVAGRVEDVKVDDGACRRPAGFDDRHHSRPDPRILHASQSTLVNQVGDRRFPRCQRRQALAMTDSLARSSPSMLESAAISWRLASRRRTSRNAVSMVSLIEAVPSSSLTCSIRPWSTPTLVFLNRSLQKEQHTYAANLKQDISCGQEGISAKDIAAPPLPAPRTSHRQCVRHRERLERRAACGPAAGIPEGSSPPSPPSRPASCAGSTSGSECRAQDPRSPPIRNVRARITHMLPKGRRPGMPAPSTSPGHFSSPPTPAGDGQSPRFDSRSGRPAAAPQTSSSFSSSSW